VVRAAFGQRRRMLRTALAALAAARGLPPAALAAWFERAGVDPRARAETLALDDFARLAAALGRGRVPELPEVETLVRGLEPVLRGRRIAARDVREPRRRTAN